MKSKINKFTKGKKKCRKRVNSVIQKRINTRITKGNRTNITKRKRFINTILIKIT